MTVVDRSVMFGWLSYPRFASGRAPDLWRVIPSEIGHEKVKVASIRAALALRSRDQSLKQAIETQAAMFDASFRGEPSMTRMGRLAYVTCLASVLAACDDKPITSASPPPVTVSPPLQKSITEWDEYTGRFTAVETVEIRARVSGFIESIHFQDGQIVKQGDLLFVIDPRPYRIAVEQAKADLERARAKLDIATLDVDRATPLARSQNITEREFDTRKSTQRDAAGAVGSADAALKQAELNLEWTAVRAPISGRI